MGEQNNQITSHAPGYCVGADLEVKEASAFAGLDKMWDQLPGRRSDLFYLSVTSAESHQPPLWSYLCAWIYRRSLQASAPQASAARVQPSTQTLFGELLAI